MVYLIEMAVASVRKRTYRPDDKMELFDSSVFFSMLRCRVGRRWYLRSEVLDHPMPNTW